MNQNNDIPAPTSTLTLLASCDETTYIRSTGVEVVLRSPDPVTVKRALTSATGMTSRIYVALEGIRGTFDAAVLRVLLRNAASASGALGDEVHLGSVALFGLRTASSPGPDGKRMGMTSYLDITPTIEQFEQQALSGNAQFLIAIRPHNKLPEGVEISIERIGLYAEPGSAPSLQALSPA